jgi:hypothetical protein
VDNYLVKNHYQLPNLGNGIQRSGWEEGCSKRYVDRSTQDSFNQEDGEDIQTWGGSICCRMLDHYSEGFRRSTTVPYKDEEFIGMTSAGI